MRTAENFASRYLKVNSTRYKRHGGWTVLLRNLLPNVRQVSGCVSNLFLYLLTCYTNPSSFYQTTLPSKKCASTLSSRFAVNSMSFTQFIPNHAIQSPPCCHHARHECFLCLRSQRNILVQCYQRIQRRLRPPRCRTHLCLWPGAGRIRISIEFEQEILDDVDQLGKVC